MANFFSRVFFGPTGGEMPMATAQGNLVPISPWAEEANVHSLIYRDLFPGTQEIVNRATAMKVAPVKRGRAIIVGSVADLPLSSGSFDGDTWVPANRQPAWLNRSTSVQTPWHRMANTFDDLVFHGWSLWVLKRSPETGTILDGVQILRERWEFDQQSPTGLSINKQHVTDPRSVILFQGPDEGLLATGADIIRGARAMEKAWVGRVQSPIPAMVLHEVNSGSGSKVDSTTAQQYVDAWAAARANPQGAIGFLPANLQMEVYGDTDADLFTEGRNNIRLDVANLLNLPASLLDGSTATASLTYQTAQGEFSQLNSWLEYWLAPVEARLSADDVTPQGQVVRFDRSNLSAVPTQPFGPELDETPETESTTPLPQEEAA